MKLIQYTLSLLIYITILFSQTPIAILNFEAFGVSSPEVNALTNRLRNELHNTGSYRVFERGKMEELLQEQGFQQTGCTSDECLVEVGRLIGVQQMVGGSISKVGYVFSVSTRIIDVETGELLKAADYDHEGDIGALLKIGMKNVALMLSGKTPIQYTTETKEPTPVVTEKPVIAQKPQISRKPNLQRLQYYESKKKSPGSALLLNVLLPSAGHLYAGHWGRGLLFLGAMGLSLGYAVEEGIVYTEVWDEWSGDYYEKEELTDDFYIGMGLASLFWWWHLFDASKVVKRDNQELYDTLFSENRLEFDLRFIPTRKGAKISLSYNF